MDKNQKGSYLEGLRLEFVLLISFGVVGATLLVLGLICSTFGLSVAIGLIIFGLLLIIAAVALGVEFGFIEGKGTMIAPIQVHENNKIGLGTVVFATISH